MPPPRACAWSLSYSCQTFPNRFHLKKLRAVIRFAEQSNRTLLRFPSPPTPPPRAPPRSHPPGLRVMWIGARGPAGRAARRARVAWRGGLDHPRPPWPRCPPPRRFPLPKRGSSSGRGGGTQRADAPHARGDLSVLRPGRSTGRRGRRVCVLGGGRARHTRKTRLPPCRAAGGWPTAGPFLPAQAQTASHPRTAHGGEGVGSTHSSSRAAPLCVCAEGGGEGGVGKCARPHSPFCLPGGARARCSVTYPSPSLSKRANASLNSAICSVGPLKTQHAGGRRRARPGQYQRSWGDGGKEEGVLLVSAGAQNGDRAARGDGGHAPSFSWSAIVC